MKNIIKTSTLFIAIIIAGRTHGAAVEAQDSSFPRAPHAVVHDQATRAAFYTPPSPAGTDPVTFKKFAFSAVFTPDFDYTVPPVSLYFEKGIAKFTSLGLNLGFGYFSKSEVYQTAIVLLGVRACGYAIPAVSALGGKEVNSYGFDPYIGLTYNTYIQVSSDSGDDPQTNTSSNLGVVLGTRWYPGKKRHFGLLAEYGTNGMSGGGLRFGITLGR